MSDVNKKENVTLQNNKAVWLTPVFETLQMCVDVDGKQLPIGSEVDSVRGPAS